MIAFPASLLILDRRSAGSPPLRDTVVKPHDEGVEIHVCATWEKGDAQRYADEARQLDIATAMTGDGNDAINEVSTTLIQSQGDNILVLDILPLGMTNDFVTSVGTPDDLGKALKLTVAVNTTAINTMQVNDKTCFISMVTGGFDTRITTETPEKLGAALGGVSYFIRGLIRMDTSKSDTYDTRGEGFHWQGKALVISIDNSRQTGGGQQLCPTVLTNDSLLQLRILTGEELLPGLFSVLTQSEDNPSIIRDASSRFDIHVPHGIASNLDGEPLSGQKSHIGILPATLHRRLPPGCPLLR